MGIEQNVKVTLAECDAPGCFVSHYVNLSYDDDILMGVYGTVEHHHEGGGNAAKWYACSMEHIGEAVKEALRKAWEA